MSELTNEKIREWLDDVFDGGSSPADIKRLSTRLIEDETARRIYVEAIQLQAGLEWLYGGHDSLVAASSNGKPRQNDDSCTFDSLALVLKDDGFNQSPIGSISDASVPSVQLRPAPQVADGDDVRDKGQVTLVGAISRLSRYAAASLILLLSVTAVVAGERIITFVRHVLMPPRTAIADEGGGVLRSGTEERLGAGANVIGTRRVGSSGVPCVALANVFMFPLPRLDGLERIHQARLEWTYKYKDSEPEFSVDLYGLGYLKAGRLVGEAFWEGAHDASLRSAYGMEGESGRRVVRIAAGVMTPETQTGRIALKNAELTRFLQSLYDDGAQQGDLAVFRLNADAPTQHIRRSTGYAVVHPPARQRNTLPSELPLLSITAERGVPADAYAVAGSSVQSITAHWASGAASSRYASILPGCDHHGVRRVGSSFWTDSAVANVLVFTLPNILETEQVAFASLEWTLHSLQGAPQFSVDLYGLGYVAGDNYMGPCFWEGERDGSLSAEYGLAGPTDGRVAMIARGVMDTDTKPGRIVVASEELSKFLRFLYANGARGGDLVVFRLNADTSTQIGPRSTGYSVVHPPSIAGYTTQADLPVLRVTAR
jgi:hypothetical protein